MLRVRLGRFCSVVFGMELVGRGEMGMMAGLGVLAGLVMLGGFTMVLSRLLIMLGRLGVMFSGAFGVLRHYQSPCYASEARCELCLGETTGLRRFYVLWMTGIARSG
jgi:hypothetical protein